MKVCFKCGCEKPYSEYYKHKGMSDGHLGKCKACTKADVKERRVTNPAVQEYDRMRGNRQDASYVRMYRKNNPEKYAAHSAVRNAVRSGKLVRPDCCENCGSGYAIEGHHDDYSKPLDIRWLCARCHALWHSEHGESKPYDL